MPRKLKTYLALQVLLPHVPDAHSTPNGGKQYTILVRAANQREVAELVGGTLRYLRVYGGIHEAPEAHGFHGEHKTAAIVKKDHVIYYQPGHTRSGYIGEWFEYQP